jgi:small-conductance mechanosensitive channel
MQAPTAALQAGTPSPAASEPGFGSTEPWAPFEWLPEIVPDVVYRLVLAVVILLAAYYLSQLARQLLGRPVARRFNRPSVTRSVLRGVQGLFMLAALAVSLGLFGFGFGNLALSVGVFSAVLGVVLAPIIGSVLSGIFILNEQPYEIGDMIELVDTGTVGFVEDITLFYTKIFTLDNTFMVMPNGSMRDRDVVNHSAEDARVRLTLEVGVTYESDLETAREQLEAAARDVDTVIKGGPDIRVGSARYPASPTCFIRQFGDSEVLLRLRYWAAKPYRQVAVRSAVMTNVWERFEEHDIEIPYPHSHVVFDDTSGELQVAARETADAETARAGGATRRDAATGDPDRTPGESTPGDSPDDDGSDSDPGDDATGRR